MPDVGTYRLGASVARIPPSAQSKCSRPDMHVFFFLRVFGHSSFIGTVVPAISIRPFWKRRTHLPVRPYIAIIHLRSWRSPASAVLAVPHILSLHSVDRPPAFSAMRDVGTYRLGASVVRTAPAAKPKYSRPDTPVFPSSAFFVASSRVETSVPAISIRPFWKRRAHLLVHSYLFILYLLTFSVFMLEKPRDFDPFGQTGWSPLATM